MNPLDQALKNKSLKESLLKKRNYKPTERDLEIKRNNERAANGGLKIVAKDRHQRRHEGKKGTSLQDRKKWMDEMSKD